jgi:iron complex transport system permease protein
LALGAVLLALSAALVLFAMLAVSTGPLPIPWATVWKVIVHHVTGYPDPSGATLSEDRIVWELRLPRVLLGALVGGGLAVVGVAIQALVRNALADAYLLGISSGASVGAVSFIVLGVSVLGISSVAGAAFLGALASFGIVYVLARRGGALAPLRLVLVGVAVGYCLSGVTSYLVLHARDPAQTNSVLFWLLGSLAKAQWSAVTLPAAVLGAGTVILFARARAMNALMAGDEAAASLGISTERLRRELFALTSLLTGVMVALSGGIGFVGLVVPHAMRMIVGGDHRRLLPAALLGGAAFLVAADLVARIALRPEELPIGIVTSLVGSPLFLWLMHRRGVREVS